MSITPTMKAERIAEDIRRVKAYDQWPWKTHLPVKSQPWVTKEFGGGRTGIIFLEANTTVMSHDLGTVLEKFESIEAMCNKWSVD